MSQSLKQGKRPINQKPKQLREEDIFGNPLTIPPAIQAELKEKKLEGRFIDAKKLYENHGYHPKGWIPYKRSTPKSGTIEVESVDFKSGSDPDGTFRRGSLILAVRSIDASNQHRELNRQKADRQRGHMKSRAAELRQMARENFGEAKRVIYEGYEDESGTEDDNDD